MVLQDEIRVIIESDDFWTNLLLILNIIITLIVSLFVKTYIEKKTKEFEVKAHTDKIIASKVIDFCILVNKKLSNYCQKNPFLDEITLDDVKEIQSLFLTEEILFIDTKLVSRLKTFCDYLILLKDNPDKKNIETEKYFFYKLREFINA